jgi:hypothetical protein
MFSNSLIKPICHNYGIFDCGPQRDFAFNSKKKSLCLAFVVKIDDDMISGMHIFGNQEIQWDKSFST